MGIFEWVKGQTGVWGPALLDAYLRNASWLNVVFIAYGLLLLLSWQNLSRIYDALIEQIVEQARRKVNNDLKNKKPQTIHLSDFDLSWQAAIAASKFPFVAKQSGLMVHRSSPENIRALITNRELIHRSARRLGAMGLYLEQER